MSTVLSSVGLTFRHNLRNALSIAEFKKKWIKERLIELKEERGLSGAAVGRRMGLTRSRISQVKKGRAVDDAFIERFCNTFNFTFPVYTSTEAVDTGKGQPASPNIDAAVDRIERALNGVLAQNALMLARYEEVKRELAEERAKKRKKKA